MKGMESNGSVSDDNVPLWAKMIPWILKASKCQWQFKDIVEMLVPHLKRQHSKYLAQSMHDSVLQVHIFWGCTRLRSLSVELDLAIQYKDLTILSFFFI